MVGGALAGIPDAVSGALTPVGAAGPSAAAVVAGKVVHSAAHGVAGGLMSMAMGGTFKDGFIGSAIGAGVSHITGALPFMEDLQGSGAVKVIARTAIASISGGVASVLAGGKFADAAFSAAFFHVFNKELHASQLSRVNKLKAYAESLLTDVNSGKLSVLDAGAMVVNYEATMLSEAWYYHDKSAIFIEEISYVLAGSNVFNSVHVFGGNAGMKMDNTHYVSFGQSNTGFNISLQDDSNQLRHFIGMVALGYKTGGTPATVVLADMREWFGPGAQQGEARWSTQDTRLNLIAIPLGGRIDQYNYSKLGAIMKEVLK
jgi:hypothetical protein